ncbi:TonB-dependent receptor [Aquabacterium sp. OR-4]|uniref:TonB-dependent receptor n=1 Tax=Aquabacterium sp. OR-4 TaxID=2978127 RepID=UPI0028C62AC7|nr:TonB-dependent receptor plug domain-containing protein [Aquabacterium sp. OR-4]MDT7838582.1 TonB-dependent receptor plug domain-containing protein [Aquabacterium sp. OR-4]
MKRPVLHPLAMAMLSALSAYSTNSAYAQAAPAAKAEQEVIVTANKVSQSALKVGASLSAVGADDLRELGVADAKALTDLIPNTQISQAGGSTVVVNIRGIDNTNTTPGGEPAAAFHIDGIYFGRMNAAGSAFFDIERVEVLRGPQGTLYGRNANAGVVNVITKAPNSVRGGYVSGELGNLGQMRFDGAYNLPVNDSLALRMAFSSNRRDGYSQTKTATNGFGENRDNVHTDSLRLQALAKFSPQTTLHLSYDFSANKGSGPNYYDLTSGVIPTRKLVDTTNSLEGKFNDQSYGWKAELKTDLGFANLTYIYGDRSFKQREDYSVSALALLADADVHQTSHELRLASRDNGPLQWVGGLFAYNEKTTNLVLDGVVPAPGPLTAAQCGGLPSCYGILRYTDGLLENDSKAVFGQITYSLDSQNRLIAGARTTSDRKLRSSGQQFFSSDGTFDPATGFITPLYGEGKWKSPTYRLGYERDLATNQMFYASVSTGFKAGGFNDGDTRTQPEFIYRPEKINSYEMGVNGKFLNNALQLTSSLFHYKYSEMQRTGIVNNSAVTVNTGRASVSGLEATARYRISPVGRVDLSLGLLDAKYSDFHTPNGADFSGRSMDKSPQFTLNLGYTHHWDLASGARLTGYVGTKYSSAYNLTDVGTATAAPIVFRQQSFTKSNLSIMYTSPSDAFDVQVYVKNLENTSQLMGTTSLAGTNYGYMSEPRTFGVRSTFRF